MDYVLHIGVELLATISEANSIISENKKLMGSISLLAILINSVLYFFNLFSVKPYIESMLTMGQNFLVSSPSGSPEFAKLVVDLQNITGSIISLQSAFVLLNYLVFLVLTTTIVISTTLVHVGQKDSSLKSIFLMVIKLLKRPFLTSIYTCMLTLGYLMIVLPIVVFVLFKTAFTSPSTFLFTATFAYICYTYFSIVWTLSLIVSILEELHGLQALAKAEQLFKGMKVQGFLLNLCFAVVFVVLLRLELMFAQNYSMEEATAFGLLGKLSFFLFGMYWYVAYTVFYFICKMNKGEEVEFQGSIDQYTKLTDGAPLIYENIF